MARSPVPFMGVYYTRRFVFESATKKAAGIHVYSLLSAAEQGQTSASAMAKYTSPIHYCPKQRIFWFELTSMPRHQPRLIHWAWIPEGMRSRVPELESPLDLEEGARVVDSDFDVPRGAGVRRQRRWSTVQFDR